MLLGVCLFGCSHAVELFNGGLHRMQMLVRLLSTYTWQWHMCFRTMSFTIFHRNPLVCTRQSVALSLSLYIIYIYILYLGTGSRSCPSCFEERWLVRKSRMTTTTAMMMPSNVVER